MSELPTRWGTQLNGNPMDEGRVAMSLNHLPTRWGTQLNGNSSVLLGYNPLEELPTRWGTQLNGNTHDTAHSQ